VISGPSGVGKGTLIAKLMADYPEVFKFSVSHTTREPRDGEEDGVHYNFSTHDKISQAISDGKFLESANVHGNIYGTSSEAVRTVVNAGKICVLDVDVQGMTTIKNSEFSPLCVFIVPPTMTELEARLRGRKTETEEAIQLRLTNAKKELDLVKPGFANAMVVNDDVDNAYDQLLNNLRTWYPKAGL
jgi:guanylate kinase